MTACGIQFPDGYVITW